MIKCIVVIALFILAACGPGKKKADTEVLKFLGTDFVTSENQKQLLDSLFQNKDYVLVLYLEPSQCVPCSLIKVTMFSYHADMLAESKTDVCLLLSTQGNEEKEEILSRISQMDLFYAHLFDENNSSVSNNKYLKNPLCQTFVIDKNYRVIWVGNPIRSEESIKLYTEMILKLRES